MLALCGANSAPGEDDRGRDNCPVAWLATLRRAFVPADGHSCVTAA